MSYLLALDQGTTSSRALLFDPAGNPVQIAQREFRQFFPHNGWVEHDAAEILETQLAVAHEVLAAARLKPHDVAAIGITNQRETCVLWDRSNGRAIGRAVVWQDRRTAEQCERMVAADQERVVRDKTGLVIDPYFSASKIAWMLDSQPGLRARAARGELACGTIDSWLVWHLSDGRAHVTDATNASRTALFDIHTQQWDEALLELWNVPRDILPEVVDSSGVCASTGRFGGDIPIAGIAGDQQAALFGQACLTAGLAKCTYGTGCFALLATGRQAPRSEHRLLTTVAHRIDGVAEYALEGSVFMGGATVQWLRDGLGIIERASDVEALAASVQDSGGVVLVPAFAGLGAPHWDAGARALLIGMTRGTTSAHIARAALEGIAFQVADVMQAMSADADVSLAELRVDGGAANNSLLMQIQSDLLGIPLLRPAVTESTAGGAAMLAGLGVGVYPSREAVADTWRCERRFVPGDEAGKLRARTAEWKRAVQRAGGWDNSA